MERTLLTGRMSLLTLMGLALHTSVLLGIYIIRQDRIDVAVNWAAQHWYTALPMVAAAPVLGFGSYVLVYLSLEILSMDREPGEKIRDAKEKISKLEAGSNDQ